ncbi:unnamed protein product [Vicia faba]|uniref:Transmembrane protein n=1 Tax=Vicia faba TaxID=3906 RepID=A0AAV0YDS6_VICFA|nr:unnamed protein product [Vicia faba]
MDAKLKSSLTFLTFILIVFFFVSLSPKVSQARALLSPLQGKDSAIGEVKGVFRTLKGDGPSLGVGHRFVGEMKDSGPSPGEGHKKNTNDGLS